MVLFNTLIEKQDNEWVVAYNVNSIDIPWEAFPTFGKALKYFLRCLLWKFFECKKTYLSLIVIIIILTQIVTTIKIHNYQNKVEDCLMDIDNRITSLEQDYYKKDSIDVKQLQMLNDLFWNIKQLKK